MIFSYVFSDWTENILARGWRLQGSHCIITLSASLVGMWGRQFGMLFICVVARVRPYASFTHIASNRVEWTRRAGLLGLKFGAEGLNDLVLETFDEVRLEGRQLYQTVL